MVWCFSLAALIPRYFQPYQRTMLMTRIIFGFHIFTSPLIFQSAKPISILYTFLPPITSLRYGRLLGSSTSFKVCKEISMPVL